MNDFNQKPNGNRFVHWLKNSITARMFVVGMLTLILMIPLFMVQDLIRERAARQQEVVGEISDKWGEELTVFGPVLKIPYRSFREKQIINANKDTSVESVAEIHYLYVFPEELKIDSKVDPQLKKTRNLSNRGVYQSYHPFREFSTA